MDVKLPDKNHPAWRDIITGKLKPEFKFLAARVILIQILNKIEIDSSENNINKAIDEIYEVYKSKVHLPSVQQDIQTIFGKYKENS